MADRRQDAQTLAWLTAALIVPALNGKLPKLSEWLEPRAARGRAQSGAEIASNLRHIAAMFPGAFTITTTKH